MHQQGTVAVIGAGVVGSAVAYALAREGRHVLLIDRADPGMGGASFGNAGHIASEAVEPLPSPQLLCNFWRQLFFLDGALDIPARRLPQFIPWAARFAVAALRQRTNTARLAPLVKSAVVTLANWLQEMDCPQLLRRSGHYEIWLHRHAHEEVHARARAMQLLAVHTVPAPTDLIESARNAAGATSASGLWFPDSAHVIDPLELVRAFAACAAARGARILRTEVTAMHLRGERIEIVADSQTFVTDSAVVCAGVWSAPLLSAFGLTVPLESVRGYHIELAHQSPLIDAPVVYAHKDLIVTPMAGRLRATSYMEFQPPGVPADPRKPARLRKNLRELGYRCELDGASWVGARPALPDYLPGIGCVPGSAIYYAIGHHHIGLTTAAVTAELVADLVAQRQPRHPVSAFDLKRF